MNSVINTNHITVYLCSNSKSMKHITCSTILSLIADVPANKALIAKRVLLWQEILAFMIALWPLTIPLSFFGSVHMITHLANLLLGLSLTKFALPPESPTDVCFESTTSKTLVDVINCLGNFTVRHEFYDQDSYNKAQPTALQRAAWSTAVLTLLRTNHNCSSAIVPSPLKNAYNVVPFTDSDGQSFCILYEQTILSYPKFFEKGWGHIIVPSSQDDVARHIHLSAPHPIYDGDTSSGATHLFKETGAKSLLIPGRTRNAYNVSSTCIRPTTKTSSLMTDPAHNDVCDLKAWVTTFIRVSAYRGLLFSSSLFSMQMWLSWIGNHNRGDVPQHHVPSYSFMGKQTRHALKMTYSYQQVFVSTIIFPLPDFQQPSLIPFVILGNSSWYTDDVDRPIKRLKKELLGAFNSGSDSIAPVTVSLPSDSKCILTATLNVVGRYLNHFPSSSSIDVCMQSAKADTTRGFFIHVEQTWRTASQVAWIRAINNTFTKLKTL